MKKIIILFSICIITLFIISSCSNKNNTKNIKDNKNTGNTNKNNQSSVLNNIQLQQINSNKKINLSDFKGNLILINCWTTWPIPCKNEVETLKKIDVKFKNKKFKLVSVNFDMIESNDIELFINKYKINYPVYSGTKEFIKKFNLVAKQIPSSYLISPNGNIIKKYSGKQTYSTFEQDITRNLK